METEYVDENILDIIEENNITEIVNRVEEAFSSKAVNEMQIITDYSNFNEIDTTNKDEVRNISYIKTKFFLLR